MAIRVSGAALGEIQTLYGWGAMGSWSDNQLVERFVGGAEESEAAFRILIQRHGPMVLGVCRRVLGDEHAAEDAFQATFLVFVKKARSLRDGGLLTNWLYGVALRVANKERAKGERRREIEQRAAERAPQESAGGEPDDLRAVIDEEVHRLPEHYRLPLLLCHVEGLRHDEVARRLGCPVGTVESRLSRARERLRMRLSRRGLAPTAGAMAAALEPSRLVLVPRSLVEATARVLVASPTRPVGVVGLVLAGCSRAGRALAATTAGAGTAAAALVITIGIAAAGIGALRPVEPAPAPTPPTPVTVVRTERATVRPEFASASASASTPGRPPRAVARPLSDITIDGRLDDWPSGMTRYPIQNLLSRSSSDYRTSVGGPEDVAAEFQAGYDPKDGRIYLAVVVRDDDLVAKKSSSVVANDAVEVYLQGRRPDPRPTGKSWADWPNGTAAEEMPILQYVGLPGDFPAYGDRFGANPALLYAATRDRRIEMKYRREGDVTTYEWAIQPYDEYPARRTRLEPGKTIGLEIAVVDRDSHQPKAAFLTWGEPPGIYKGFEPETLGELEFQAAR